MKKLIAVSIALCALNANAAMESKSKVKYKGDTNFKNFCEAVVVDDVALLKKSLRKQVGEVASTQSKVKALLIAEKGVKCNGVGLTEFSKERAATKVAAFLNQGK
ncbi:hypothetical protein L0668_12905 [Paraglaciecola aquimarina]|uniref:DUF3718 domain-containing protein n=1 Tax=Paraglaciecola algarum TaxID=3050085 RepID=A0ABS9DB37_9ALTE|nr:hypothetical protein [Paraglaciecola sp. G1-23]MCF2949014.1 hypothetical protein [Paraglaciecola sp. G1-23]